jgi:hypothetical protein
MASNREIVMLSGTISGMGREAACIVSAVRVSLAGATESALTRCSIHQAPVDLPEGAYQVTFAGETIR